MGEGERRAAWERVRGQKTVPPPDPGTMQRGDTPPPPDQCCPTMDPGKGGRKCWHFMALLAFHGLMLGTNVS